MLGHQILVLLPQGVNTVNHLLDKLNLQEDVLPVCRQTRREQERCKQEKQSAHLGVPEPMLVTDIVGDSSLAPWLPPGTAGLHLQLLAPRLREARVSVSRKELEARYRSKMITLRAGRPSLVQPGRSTWTEALGCERLVAEEASKSWSQKQEQNQK